MQFHFHANQSHFHKNGFALRLALKQRHKGLGNGLLNFKSKRHEGSGNEIVESADQKARELWERDLSQSEPELYISATGQKDRELWGREWTGMSQSQVYCRGLNIP